MATDSRYAVVTDTVDGVVYVDPATLDFSNTPVQTYPKFRVAVEIVGLRCLPFGAKGYYVVRVR